MGFVGIYLIHDYIHTPARAFNARNAVEIKLTSYKKKNQSAQMKHAPERLSFSLAYVCSFDSRGY